MTDRICEHCGQRLDVHGRGGCEDTPERNPFWRNPAYCGYCDRRPNQHGVTVHADGCPAAHGWDEKTFAHARALAFVESTETIAQVCRGVQFACGPREMASVHEHADAKAAERLELVKWSEGAGRWWAEPLGRVLLVVVDGKDGA